MSPPSLKRSNARFETTSARGRVGRGRRRRSSGGAVKSLRIPPELLKAIRFRARRERLDESTAIRQLIALGATEYAVTLYRDGKVTLAEAADVAGVTPRGMIEILWDHGVRGNVTVDQQRKALAFVLERA